MSILPTQAPAPISEQPQETQANTTVADPKLDLYARKERELAKKRKEFEDAKKAWESERSQYVPKKLFKDDPFRAVSEVDLDYDKLTETLMSQPNINDPTIKAIQARITQMEEADARRAQATQDAEKAQLEQAKSQKVNEIKLATNGNPEFEIIEKWGAHDAVQALMDESMEQGTEMSIQDACKQVEEMLIAEVLKVYSSEKIKTKANPVQPPASTEQTPTAVTEEKTKWKNPNGYSIENSPRNQFNTLTNRLTQESTKPSSSEKDRIARAIAAMEGRLK